MGNVLLTAGTPGLFEAEKKRLRPERT